MTVCKDCIYYDICEYGWCWLDYVNFDGGKDDICFIRERGDVDE